MSDLEDFKKWVEEGEKRKEAFRNAPISEKIKRIQKHPRDFAKSLRITTDELLDNIEHYAKIVDERLKTQGSL